MKKGTTAHSRAALETVRRGAAQSEELCTSYYTFRFVRDSSRVVKVLYDWNTGREIGRRSIERVV